MLEMSLLGPSKETFNMLRWSIFVEKDNTDSLIYIPKWRVPFPWPSLIRVMLSEFSDKYSSYPKVYKTKNNNDAINVILESVSEHTLTRHYAPIGDKSKWPIGEPYIPFSLIPSNSNLLYLRVEWVLGSKGMFHNQ